MIIFRLKSSGTLKRIQSGWLRDTARLRRALHGRGVWSLSEARALNEFSAQLIAVLSQKTHLNVFKKR